MRIRRRLLTVHPPISVDTFCELQRAVAVEFPGAVVESSAGTGHPLHIVVTQEVDDDDPSQFFVNVLVEEESA